MNLSLGGTGTAALKRAVKAAYKAGVTIVAASGNDPKEPVSSPANYPESIAVSASSKVDGIAPFASTGPEIAFIAPGVDIVSSAPGGGLAQHSGTSMASPHVAGLAALAWGPRVRPRYGPRWKPLLCRSRASARISRARG